MLQLNDEGIVIEDDWSWPVNIIEVKEIADGKTVFWAVWCAKDDECDCVLPSTIGVGETRQKALEAWRFRHFVDK